MTSSISWLDFDSRAHERSQQLLATLNEPGTRDELGLGNIRDALSDLMFPGTSTIQTRLKYMLLVPWTYAWLESRQVPARAFARRAHQMEVRLIETLSDSGQRGIIGSGARGSLKRMPSSIYWAGLRSWGLRLFDGSQTNYYNSIDRIHASRKAMERQRKEHGSAPLDATSTWHAFFRNEQWLNTPLKEQTIALSFNEAEFLRDRIYAAQPGTYLKWLAELNEPDESDFPWTQFRAAELPPDIARLVHHARLFSHLMHGASLLYSFLLSQHIERFDWADRHAEKIGDWRQRAPWDELQTWSLNDFFRLAQSTRHRIRPSAMNFVRRWHDLACQMKGRVMDSLQAGELIRRRERTLKRNRSRFDNASVRKHWRGDSATPQLNYRWRNVQWFMQDLHAGLER